MGIIRVFLMVVFAELAFIGVLFGLPLVERLPPPVIYALLVLVLGGLVALGRVLFSRRRRRVPPPAAPIDESTLVSRRFQARRAFEVEQFEDEGLTYFIELADGSILFLRGQYLYPDEDEDRFPCTEFTVRFHPRDGWGYDVTCEGEYLAPEGLAAPFSGEDHDSGRVPEDGQVIRGRTYDEVKAQWLDRERRRF